LLKKLRVLLVSPVGEIGGAEKVFLSLIEHLPTWGFEPVLACMRPGKLAEVVRYKGVEVYEFKHHRYRQIPLVWEGIHWLAQVIRETKVQLVHASHASHIYSSLATRFTKIPEVWHLHDYPYHWDWVDRLSVRLPTDYLIFTTNKVKSGYPHLHTKPNAVIPPACIDPIHLRAFTPQSNIKAKFSLPSGSLFLTVARLQEHKGHRYLIDAVPTVLKSFPNAIFAIVGKPSDDTQKEYMKSLQLHTQKLEVQEQVRFLGYIDEADLVSLYREASALVHPAISEGFGLVLLEAMLLGTPVIAAAADGPSELIVNNRSGLLVPTHDSDSLAQAIIRLLNEDQNLAKILSVEGLSLAEHFSVEKMVKETAKVYRSLVFI
jgi:glycosyltransferase involved in cell wall biosynthesis